MGLQGVRTWRLVWMLGCLGRPCSAPLLSSPPPSLRFLPGSSPKPRGGARAMIPKEPWLASASSAEDAPLSRRSDDVSGTPLRQQCTG